MNWLTNLFSGAKNLLGGAGQVLGGAGQNIMKTAAPVFKGAMNMFSGSGGSNPAQGLMGMLGGKQQAPSVSPMNMTSSGYNQMSKNQLLNSPYKPNVSNIMPGFDSMSSASSPSQKPKNNNFLQELMEQSFPGGAMQGMLGLGIPAIGNMFAPKVKDIPDASSLASVQALQNFRPGNSMSPEYRTMLQHETDRMKDQKVKELQALYRNARPGTDYLTDTNYQSDLSRINRETEEVMADNLARAEGQFSCEEQQRLSQLAQLDIFQIMQQTGLSAQEADNFKQSFSDVGNIFLTNATRTPDNQLAEILRKQFGGQS